MINRPERGTGPNEGPTTRAQLMIKLDSDYVPVAGIRAPKKRLTTSASRDEPSADAELTVFYLKEAQERIDIKASKSRKRGATALAVAVLSAVAIALALYFSTAKASFLASTVLAVTLGGAIGSFASAFRLHGARTRIDRLLAAISGQLLSDSGKTRNRWPSEDDDA